MIDTNEVREKYGERASRALENLYSLILSGNTRTVVARGVEEGRETEVEVDLLDIL